MRHKYEARLFIHSYTDFKDSILASQTLVELYDLSGPPWELNRFSDLKKDNMTAILKEITRNLTISIFNKNEIFYGITCVLPAPLNFSALYLREAFAFPTCNLKELTLPLVGKSYTEIISRREVEKVDEDFLDKLDQLNRIREEKEL